MILIGRPGNDDVIISSLALIGRSDWHHTYTIVGWRFSARWLVDSQKSPETTRKEILTVGSPFQFEFVIAADSHIQTFIESSGSTSGQKIYFRSVKIQGIGEIRTSGGNLKMKTIPLATVLLLYLGCHLFSLRKFLLRWLTLVTWSSERFNPRERSIMRTLT